MGPSVMTSEATDNNVAMPEIGKNVEAYTHVPEHGFSLFLANRTKTIHFVRHAGKQNRISISVLLSLTMRSIEGTHNEANRAYGDDTPVIHSTSGAWRYQDAYLTKHGIQQCITARQTLLGDVHPQLIVVSPFTRTLQTAHIMFNGRQVPFLVQELCRERSGKYTCDKRRTKSEIVAEFTPLYHATNDTIDFESFGYVAMSTPPFLVVAISDTLAVFYLQRIVTQQKKMSFGRQSGKNRT